MKSRSRHFRALVRIVVLALPLTLASALPHASASVPTTVTFNYTGAPQQWTVPIGVQSIIVEAWGAASKGLYLCAAGGYAKRAVSVMSGERLNVMVGGMSLNTSSLNGGFNGGGSGGAIGSNRGTGGGGATDLRQGGSGLHDRVIVAGGAGGSLYCGGGGQIYGGSGGGWQGGDGRVDPCNIECGLLIGRGGTQIAGGAGGVYPTAAGPGGFGYGGDGAIGGPGGGAGWFGGGGTSCSCGAGGGSGFAPDGLLENGVNWGHGRLTITYATATSPTPVYPSSGNNACTTGATTRVDRVRTDAGNMEYEVDVHHTPTEVQVCTTVRDMNSGQEIWSKDVIVDKTWDPGDIEPPITPPTVDSNAPDGEGSGSPCAPGAGQGWGGGSENARAYARTGTNSTDEPVICVGFRSAVASRHVRVTVH
jgi:hypothetical protein